MTSDDAFNLVFAYWRAIMFTGQSPAVDMIPAGDSGEDAELTERPAQPYATLKVLSPPAAIAIPGRRYDAGVVREATYRFTVSIQVFGPGAVRLVEKFNDSFPLFNSLKLQRQIGLGYERAITAPRNMTTLLNSRYEARAMVEYQFNAQNAITEAIDRITSAQIQTDITDSDGNVLVSKTLEVSLQ